MILFIIRLIDAFRRHFADPVQEQSVKGGVGIQSGRDTKLPYDPVDHHNWPDPAPGG